MKFVPKEKLGKKAKQELNRARRATWGTMNPVTRRAENKKAYTRRKPSGWYMDDSMRALFYLCGSDPYGKRSLGALND